MRDRTRAGNLGQAMSTLLRFLVCLGILIQATNAPAGIFGSGGNGKVEWQTDMKKAGIEAKRTGKPILLQLTATWCSYCHKMLKETFTDPAIAKRVNENFVPLLLDADEHEDVVEMLEVTSFPSTIVISADFEVLGRVNGFQKADAYGKKLAEFSKPGHVHVAQAANRETPNIPKPEAAMTKAEVTPPSRQDIPMPTPPTLSRALPLPDTASSNGATTTVQTAGQLNAPTTKATEARPEIMTPAFEGQCLVSMHESREPVPGSERFAYEYHGARLYFRDAEQLAKFKAEPSKYWPWFDGRCPVSVHNDAEKQMGKPQFGGVYRGRLVFFREEALRSEFARDPRTYMAGAR